MRVFNISLRSQNKNIRYERAARDIQSRPVAISPFTVIHFTPQRWQPDVTSRAIKNNEFLGFYVQLDYRGLP